MSTVIADTRPELSISPEKLGFIITKTREFDAKDMEDHPEDPRAGGLS